ncbi:hypothetical protein [Marinobacter salicampi]|uniref:hypothetical protein n=1 Tax=Marinobacter salicampi TaxID=435907 RepID=UPI00140D9749|nr:hypothetical protein [Marinobacter salicampi]
MLRTSLSIVVGALVLTGCASKEPPTVIVERTLIFEEDNRRYIHSIATTEYGNQGLGGAAVLKPATIHVMADERRTATQFESLENTAESSKGSRARKAKQAKLNTVMDQLNSLEGSDDEQVAKKLSKAMETLSSIQATDKKAHLSHYDLSLWDKFCSEGKEMSENDWGQMLSSSVDQIPEAVRTDCKVPDLSPTDDIRAAHCSGETLSNRAKFVIQEHEEEIKCSDNG